MSDDIEDKVVENRVTENILKSADSENSQPLVKETVDAYFKFFWIVAVALNFVLLLQIFGSFQEYQGYLAMFVSGVFAIKGFQMVEPFLNKAEKEGLVKSREELEQEE